ncbi:MAG: hypothetical protein NVS9B9_19920 [Ktedonobacteraceae bacterium]
MDQTNIALAERIRQKCQLDGWYGGGLVSPKWLDMPTDHPQRRDFAFPPVSEKQLLATEVALGFSLPLVLRTLYTRLTNGGFGPGVGLLSALREDHSHSNEVESTFVDDYYFRSQVGYAALQQSEPIQLIDLGDYTQHWQSTPTARGLLLLPYTVWPAQLLTLEDLGCYQHACLDCKTGRIFCTAPTESDEKYELVLIATSLEDYLERWLQGEMLP